MSIFRRISNISCARRWVTSEQRAIPVRRISLGSSPRREPRDVEEAKGVSPASAHLRPYSNWSLGNRSGQGSYFWHENSRPGCSLAMDHRLQDSDDKDLLCCIGSTRNFADWLAHCSETSASLPVWKLEVHLRGCRESAWVEQSRHRSASAFLKLARPLV